MYLKYEFVKFCNLDIGISGSRDTSVPSTDVFQEIYQKAMQGNEMAAFHIFDGKFNCSPQTPADKINYSKICKAFKELFMYPVNELDWVQPDWKSSRKYVASIKEMA